jgi:hypothetical protein
MKLHNSAKHSANASVMSMSGREPVPVVLKLLTIDLIQQPAILRKKL